MMIELKNYTHIIWDWNGTLLDDAWLCVEVMNEMLCKRGMPLKTLEEYKELFDFPVKDYYIKLGYDFEKEPFDEVGIEFITRYNNRQGETKLHPEAKIALKQLASFGFSQNILSAREQIELISETKSLGVSKYFKLIRGLDDHYAHGKTDAGKLLVSEIGVPKDKMLFIGDTRHDAEVAVEIGIDCVLVSNGHQSERRLQELGLPILHSLNDLI
jgi:phosphoglycolate phosphatase